MVVVVQAAAGLGGGDVPGEPAYELVAVALPRLHAPPSLSAEVWLRWVMTSGCTVCLARCELPCVEGWRMDRGRVCVACVGPV